MNRARIAAVGAAVVVAVAVVGAVALLDRDTPRSSSAAEPSPPVSPAASSPASPSPSGTPQEPAAEDPAVPSPPPTTAGPLRERNLPVASLLGRQWRAYADPGGPEAGFTGNGSWVRARDPSEVVDGLAPIGCAQLTEPPAFPLPSAALEGTYRTGSGSGSGVALALDYETDAGAVAFMRLYSSAVANCGPPPQPVGRNDPLTLVITPRTTRTDLVVDTRREYGFDASPLTWTEVVVRSGSRVALITIGTPAGAKAPDTSELAAALRTALPR